MKKIKILMLTLASSFAAMAADIDVSPGKLEGLLADEDVRNEKIIRLKGNIDARDLAAIENLGKEVETLDLKEVKIEALTMPNRKYFGRTLFSENEIPAYTFFKTSVRNLILPAGTTMICEGAFAGSSITEIEIPDGVKSIGDYAFYGCKDLKKVTLPQSLATIGKGAFGNCMSLESIDISATQIKELPERAFAGSVMLSQIKLPVITKVGREAFSHTEIKKLDLSAATEFEAYALSSMPFLEELSINPDAIIGEGLLMDDISLWSLSGMPELVPDYFAANNTELSSDLLKDAFTLGRYSFANTNGAEEIMISRSLSRIERGALSGIKGLAKINVVELINNIPEVDDLAFEGINQPDIILWVHNDYVDDWKSHPVWGFFNIQSSENEDTGIDDTLANASDSITISFRDGKVVVEAAALVRDVKIYTTDGRIAFIASPGEQIFEIDADRLPSGVVVVTAADGNGSVKTISLLL